MPRKTKTTAAEAQVTERPRGTKTAVIKAALAAHPDKLPKEIAEILKIEGWDIKPQTISVVKSNLKSQKKPKRRTAPAAAKTAVPASPKAGDTISLDSLKKAKELAAQLGGIKEAKAALAALSELLD